MTFRIRAAREPRAECDRRISRTRTLFHKTCGQSISCAHSHRTKTSIRVYQNSQRDHGTDARNTDKPLDFKSKVQLDDRFCTKGPSTFLWGKEESRSHR